MSEAFSEAARAGENHYRQVMDDNHEEWLKTFTADIQERVQKIKSSGMRGHITEFYWEAGRTRVTKYGLRYEFAMERSTNEPDRKLVFFSRIDKDGKQQGINTKLIMKNEKGEWKVFIPSY
jgi:hypothetical protein